MNYSRLSQVCAFLENGQKTTVVCGLKINQFEMISEPWISIHKINVVNQWFKLDYIQRAIKEVECLD